LSLFLSLSSNLVLVFTLIAFTPTYMSIITKSFTWPLSGTLYIWCLITVFPLMSHWQIKPNMLKAGLIILFIEFILLLLTCNNYYFYYYQFVSLQAATLFFSWTNW
jgi:hypothetical protein